MSIRPKQFARIGEFHIEESILDVLLEAKHEDVCMGAAEISQRAGIFREGGVKDIKGMNDAIVTGMLAKLYKEDKVKRCLQEKGQGGWKLTEKEFSKRRDDIAG